MLLSPKTTFCVPVHAGLWSSLALLLVDCAVADHQNTAGVGGIAIAGEARQALRELEAKTLRIYGIQNSEFMHA